MDLISYFLRVACLCFEPLALVLTLKWDLVAWEADFKNIRYASYNGKNCYATGLMITTMYFWFIKLYFIVLLFSCSLVQQGSAMKVFDPHWSTLSSPDGRRIGISQLLRFHETPRKGENYTMQRCMSTSKPSTLLLSLASSIKRGMRHIWWLSDDIKGSDYSNLCTI